VGKPHPPRRVEAAPPATRTAARRAMFEGCLFAGRWAPHSSPAHSPAASDGPASPGGPALPPPHPRPPRGADHGPAVAPRARRGGRRRCDRLRGPFGCAVPPRVWPRGVRHAVRPDRPRAVRAAAGRVAGAVRTLTRALRRRHEALGPRPHGRRVHRLQVRVGGDAGRGARSPRRPRPKPLPGTCALPLASLRRAPAPPHSHTHTRTRTHTHTHTHTRPHPAATTRSPSPPPSTRSTTWTSCPPPRSSARRRRLGRRPSSATTACPSATPSA
jgi:hypothetical protein